MTDSPTSPRSEGMDQQDELTLAAVPSAASLARLLVQFDLARWSFDDSFIRRVEAVTDELVVHAVATTGVMKEVPFYAAVFDDLHVIVVRLRTFGERVVVEVWDRTEAPPHVRLSKAPAIAGSEHWDFAVPRPGRRVVWCVVAPERAAGDSADESLPQRVPASTRSESGVPPANPVDTAVLLRVVDGLRRAP